MARIQAVARARKQPWSAWVLVNYVPGGVAAIMFMAAVFILDPRPPFALSNGEAINSPVRPGETVKVDWVQTWKRKCHAESVRVVVRSDHKRDTYEKTDIEPPAELGPTHKISTATISAGAPPGPAIYRATVTFPAQISFNCIMPWARDFTTPDVPFMVARVK